MTCEVDGRFGADRCRGGENDQKHGKNGAADPHTTPGRRIPLVSASAVPNSTLTRRRALAKVAVVHC
jgi:hypothetical protein